MLEDSLERILGDKSINVIVMHDKNYSTDRYASFGEVKASFDTLNGCAIRTSAVNLTAFMDFVKGKNESYDDNGHGTHCAAVAAGTGGSRENMSALRQERPW